jgi:hypothetical protein
MKRDRDLLRELAAPLPLFLLFGQSLAPLLGCLVAPRINALAQLLVFLLPAFRVQRFAVLRYQPAVG